MKKERKINYLLIIIILICAITVIYTNHIFLKTTEVNIKTFIIENEYNKLGGKENYLLVRELQKQEMLGYIDKLKKEQPELIEELTKKINTENEEEIKETEENILPQDFMNELKNDSYIKGNTGAVVTIVEFSDLECSYCADLHTAGIIESLSEKYGELLNYIFKNFPLPSHENSEKEAEAAMCIKNISDGDKYLKFIDLIYNNTEGGGEGFDLDHLTTLAKKVGVDAEQFEECYNNGTYKDEVQKEFQEGITIGIQQVPSNLIFNNTTGKFKILTENVGLSDFEEVIDELME